MTRRLAPEDLEVWLQVARTVRPLPGRVLPKPQSSAVPRETKPGQAYRPTHLGADAAPGRRMAGPMEPIEPRRKRRLIRGQLPIEATLDLHGHDQDQARAALRGFLARAHGAGYRAVLVITGRGARGGGVLRERTPEWLQAPDLRPLIAGFSQAHQKHGGDGALYVALKAKA